MNDERRLAYRLALRLGYANPDAMRAGMPWSVWRGWIEYARLEPFGEDRADLRIAQLAALVANAWLRKKGSRRYKVDDFMFHFGEQRAKTPDQLAEQIIGINRALGGTFIDKRPKETG